MCSQKAGQQAQHVQSKSRSIGPACAVKKQVNRPVCVVKKQVNRPSMCSQKAGPQASMCSQKAGQQASMCSQKPKVSQQASMLVCFCNQKAISRSITKHGWSKSRYAQPYNQVQEFDGWSLGKTSTDTNRCNHLEVSLRLEIINITLNQDAKLFYPASQLRRVATLTTGQEKEAVLKGGTMSNLKSGRTRHWCASMVLVSKPKANLCALHKAKPNQNTYCEGHQLNKP